MRCPEWDVVYVLYYMRMFIDDGDVDVDVTCL